MSTGSAATSSAPANRKSVPRKTETPKPGGHFAAIYENERFVRFKYMHNN